MSDLDMEQLQRQIGMLAMKARLEADSGFEAIAEAMMKAAPGPDQSNNLLCALAFILKAVAQRNDLNWVVLMGALDELAAGMDITCTRGGDDVQVRISRLLSPPKGAPS